MTIPIVLVATWSEGLVVVSGENREHELSGDAVRGLASDGHGGALAIVGGRSLRRRTSGGEWVTVATHACALSCCVVVGDDIYVGTDDARVLRFSHDGRTESLDGFDSVEGRDTWYAGSAVIDGQVVGPPLGVRSMTATADGKALLANVHVGGIPRSTDEGASWHPTIDVDCDVHQVLAHPSDPALVIAASAVGLCVSSDGGKTWEVETEGLPSLYGSAVAFSETEILIAASADHFAAEGAIYRRSIAGPGPLTPFGGGLPRWIEGIADTGCISSHAGAIAVADKGGHVHLSIDGGRTWTLHANDLPNPSGILLV